MRWALAGIALGCGILAAFAGTPYRRHDVTAIELAQWIKDRKPELHVIDLRSPNDFRTFHVPTSVHASTVDPRPDETFVVVSDQPIEFDAPNVYVLRGGAMAWKAEVTPTALGRYFGGTRRGGC